MVPCYKESEILSLNSNICPLVSSLSTVLQLYQTLPRIISRYLIDCTTVNGHVVSKLLYCGKRYTTLQVVLLKYIFVN